MQSLSKGSRRLLVTLLCVALSFGVLHRSAAPVVEDDGVTVPHRRLASQTQLTVFGYALDHPIARKLQQDLSLSLPSDAVQLSVRFLTLAEQRDLVQSRCGDAAVKQFDLLQPHLAVELFKWCALSTHSDDAAFIDSSGPLLSRLPQLLQQHATSSLAVLGDDYFPQTIHGSLIVLRRNQQEAAKKMLSLLTDTDVKVLQASPLLIPRTLYALIAVNAQTNHLTNGANNQHWYLLEQTCKMDVLSRSSTSSTTSSHVVIGWSEINSHRIAHHCPERTGFCCYIHDEQIVSMSRHPILPYQLIPEELPKPYNAEAGHFSEEDLPYISIVREQVFHRPADFPATPNFFDTLLRNDCLPKEDDCNKCLREKKGADCNKCAKACPCYCKTLCKEMPDKKHVAKQLLVTPPLYSRDLNRIIPKIIHQTWFEPLSKSKYPNMSRLVESFRQSGWEYKFWSDAEAQNFLSTHFPAEVREAYDALRPGAFKADLFRYCVLLIHGGVYAGE